MYQTLGGVCSTAQPFKVGLWETAVLLTSHAQVCHLGAQFWYGGTVCLPVCSSPTRPTLVSLPCPQCCDEILSFHLLFSLHIVQILSSLSFVFYYLQSSLCMCDALHKPHVFISLSSSYNEF